MTKIRLFTSLYPETVSQRRLELRRCLRNNLDSPIVDSLCLFLERVPAPRESSNKLILRDVEFRPTYDDFFEWANQFEIAQTDLTVIANSDVFLDDNIFALSLAMKSAQCAALSRWDVTKNDGSVLYDRNDSQDVWVFRGPLKKIDGDFCVGVPRCDNRMLYELKRAGYEVINPAFSVRVHHLHAGVRGEYQKTNLDHFIEPPYGYLYPHNLWSLPRTIIHNVLHAKARVSWRFDRRKFMRNAPMRALRKIITAQKQKPN